MAWTSGDKNECEHGENKHFEVRNCWFYKKLHVGMRRREKLDKYTNMQVEPFKYYWYWYW